MQIRHNVSESEITKNLSEAQLNLAQAGVKKDEVKVKELAVHKDAMVAGLDKETKIQTAKIAADAKKQSGASDGGTK